ncbi:hypothetical protein ACRRTK_008272 [Alexandromys fortis]
MVAVYPLSFVAFPCLIGNHTTQGKECLVVGERRAALRDPDLPLPRLSPPPVPVSPSSHCLVGLGDGACYSLTSALQNPRQATSNLWDSSSVLELFLYLVDLGLILPFLFECLTPGRRGRCEARYLDFPFRTGSGACRDHAVQA